MSNNTAQWTITKSFDFCYGHRVWNQVLDKEYSIDDKCACRHLHGHQGTVNVSLPSDKLTNGMVVDFKMLNWFKKFLDDVLDHKFIMDINDPLVSVLFNYGTILNKEELLHKEEGYYTFNPVIFPTLTNYIKELYEGTIFVDFVPTSENLSKWLFDIVDTKMKKIGCKVSKLEFFETPKSRSIYEKNG